MLWASRTIGHYIDFYGEGGEAYVRYRGKRRFWEDYLESVNGEWRFGVGGSFEICLVRIVGDKNTGTMMSAT